MNPLATAFIEAAKQAGHEENPDFNGARQDGVGRFQLETAEISGVPIPKPLLQELVGYYSRTPENPAGINMDDTFELPARIREIRVAQGIATIVQ